MDRDRLEFAEFYAATRDDCLRMVTVSVGDRQLAEDLVAEAFTRAWMSWGKVRRHPAPRAWVVRTALNVHISWWRRHRRETALDGHDDVAEAAGPDYSEPEDDLVIAVRKLPPRQRAVITLRVFFDLDAETTAELLGISRQTVGVHLHRAIARLRTQTPSPTDQGVR